MTTYLRVAGGIAVEAWTAPDGVLPAACFTPDIAAQLVAASGGATVGWIWANGAWAAPVTPAPTQAQLVADANAKQVALRDGGIKVNIGSTGTPDLVDVASDATGRGLVTGCVQLIGVAQQAGQSAPTFPWINNDGTQLTLTAPQMMSIALDLGNFVQATYATLGAVLAAIAAGTITTFAQIDAAAWPATSY